MKTAIRRFLGIAKEDAGQAEPALRQAFSQLDRAAAKGVIHPNAAARRKSRLAAQMALRSVEPEPEPASAEPPAGKRPSRKRVGTGG